jgi:hypothetical protein
MDEGRRPSRLKLKTPTEITKMKTINLKHSLASGGNLMPQQAGAKPGYRNGCMPAWLDNVDASQAGKNLYRAENLTENQLATVPDWYREKYCQPS